MASPRRALGLAGSRWHAYISHHRLRGHAEAGRAQGTQGAAVPLRPTATRATVEVEINTREHEDVCGVRTHPFTVENPWFTGSGRTPAVNRRARVPSPAVDHGIGDLVALRADVNDRQVALARGLECPRV